MKRLIPLLLLCLLLCGCAQKEADPTAAPTAAPTDTPTDPTQAPSETTTQAPAYARVLTRMARLDENGQELWYMEYEYDPQGRVLSETEVQSGQGQTCLRRYAYDGDTQTITCSYSDGTLEELVQLLDDHGRVIHSYYSVYTGDPIPATQYAYDEYGNLESCSQWLDGEDISVQIFLYTYTPEGRIDTAEELVNGEKVGRTVYHYDDRGRVAEVEYYDASGLYQTAVHTWDGCTQTVTFFGPGDTLEFVRISTYDTDDGSGNLLYEETRQEGWETISMEYTYEDIELSEH